jgi:hypothetical protein
MPCTLLLVDYEDVMCVCHLLFIAICLSSCPGRRRRHWHPDMQSNDLYPAPRGWREWRACFSSG